MEELLLLNKLLQKEDYLCKIELRDAYIAPLHQDSQKGAIYKVCTSRTNESDLPPKALIPEHKMPDQ